ncbi:quinon protein alcohol dehydrogenase-like superfamily [Rhizoctonia solani]|nr:quinon protein alcohol dehydrogenase-like superfamily [Rhizoctonia solani]
MWIRRAGTGKTTIAYSLCEELAASGRLAVSFFCSRLLPECRDANRVIPSIAYQLARYSRPFRSVLSDALERDPDGHTRLSNLQFDALIAQPLRQVEGTLPESLIVIIDALDECENKRSSRRVLDVLLTKLEGLPVKFIISSRPEPEIQDEMTKQGDQAQSRVMLHELDADTVQADIKTYLQATLARIKPSETQISALVERAGILFIYAATVVRYIGYNNFQGNSEARLASVLNTLTGTERKEIDEIYTTVLRAALNDPELEDEDKDDMQQVLRTVICAQEPLTVDALSELLKMNGTKQVHAALRPLWSVLHISHAAETLITLHASFSDSLFDPLRSGQYHCDRQAHNLILALHCFDCFRNMSPQFNICGLESSFVNDDQVEGLEARVKQSIANHVFYAARYWAVHLCSALRSPELVGELEEFLSVRLLLWMEIMNLKRRTSSMPELIRLVEQGFMRDSTELRALIHDTWCFAITFASGAVSICVWSTQSGETVLGPLRGNNSLIWSVAFSPEGSRIVSGSSNGTICIWDACGGQLLLDWFIGYAEQIRTVRYSPNNRYIISIGQSSGIVVWNPENGQVLKGFRQNNLNVQFRSGDISPDGTRIASGSGNNSIYVWNTQTGQVILGPLTVSSHSFSISSVCFSHDGSWIVSGSNDKTICVWDSLTGDLLLGPLEGHTNYNVSASFSPDNAYIVSGSVDRMLRLWDTPQSMRTAQKPPHGHSSSIRSVGISPDGTRIVSGSEDGAICVWDSKSGELIISLPKELFTHVKWFTGEVEFSHVRRVTFSPDNTRIVVNTDHGPFAFDARSGSLCSLYGDHISSPDLLCVLVVLVTVCILLPLRLESGNDTMLVSALLINTHILLVKAFRLVIEGLKMDFIGFQDPVNKFNALVFQAILIMVTGVRVIGDTVFGPVDIHSPRISCADFSSDGTQIVSGSADGIIRVHDACTNRLALVIILPPTDTGNYRLETVSFSSDGCYIFSKSEGGKMQRHDAKSGQLLVDSKGTTEWGYTDELSPDGKRIVAKGHSSIVLVDLASRKRLELGSVHHGSRLTEFSFWSGSVRFTPDNSRIATILKNGLFVTVWDTHTGELLLNLNKELTGMVRSMAFLPDGGGLVTGSKDGTIQITDVRSGLQTYLQEFPTGK